MIFKGKNKEYLQLDKVNTNNYSILNEEIESSLTLVWFVKGETLLNIDGKIFSFKENQIITLTEFNKINVIKIDELCLVRFNRSFYCIAHNDSEVGCKGLLFFGAHQLPIINLPKNEQEKFDILWRMFCIEMESKDDLQVEMLQMMLKRLLILCARLYKEQNEITVDKSQNIDLVREFNILIETHFRSKHSVTEYAEMLNKSPKTLSNIFSKIYHKTPLQFIQERLILEAKRQLLYSDKTIKEIAYEIGFDDIQSFSRFFKGKLGVSPSDFKNQSPKE
jgi:AraC-like DNA-binding protein